MSLTSRRGVLRGLAAGSIAVAAIGAAPTGAAAEPLSSDVDVAHAARDLVTAVTTTFRDKSAHDVNRTMAHFSQTQLTYTDGTLGLQFRDWAQLGALFAQLMPTWPESARSYPTRIIGQATSGIVLFTDTPELFGGEIRSISPIDLSDGRIIRQVDYWDSRHFGTAAAAGLRVPAAQYPSDFGEQQIGERSHPTIRRVSTALAGALSAGDVTAVTALLGPDAVFEDLALHTQLVGRQAIASFLARALPLLPYGRAAVVRHVVGGVLGGGYEWTSQRGPVSVGVVALELDRQARVTRVTATWDGAALDVPALTDLLATTVEQ